MLKDKSLIFLAIILLVSLYPRLWKLENLPPINVDEYANLKEINRLVVDDRWGINDFHWDFSKTYLSYLPVTYLVGHFKEQNPLYSLRLVSVFYSLVALIPMFFIIKNRTNDLVAFLTTLAFSLNYYFLQFSRVGWTDVIFVLSTGLYLFWLLEEGLKKNRSILIITSAVFAGLIFYGYRSGIIYLGAAVLYLVYTILFKKTRAVSKLTTFLFFLIPLAFVVFPWFTKILENRIQYELRQRVVEVKNVVLPYHNQTNKKGVFNYQISTSLKSWILLLPTLREGSENPRYLPQNSAPINTFTKIAFWLGLIFISLNVKKYKYHFLWIFIMACGIYFGQILTVDPPNGSRGLIMLPSYFIISSVALNEMFLKIKDYKLLIYGLILLIIIFSVCDFIFYQNWMSYIKV